MEHPILAENVDFLLIHIHPYWNGVDIENAAQYVVEKYYTVMQAYPEKEIIIGETGWPTIWGYCWRCSSQRSISKIFFKRIFTFSKKKLIFYIFILKYFMRIGKINLKVKYVLIGGLYIQMAY